jgi:hypothetical protein
MSNRTISLECYLALQVNCNILDHSVAKQWVDYLLKLNNVTVAEPIIKVHQVPVDGWDHTLEYPEPCMEPGKTNL